MMNPNCDQSVKKLDFPPHNTLIPTEFDLKEKNDLHCKEPLLLKKWDDGTDLWYHQDNKFNMPKEIVKMSLYLENSKEITSAKGELFFCIWKDVVDDYLREFLYMSEMALLDFSVAIDFDKVSFVWNGFSQTIETFVN